MKASKASTNSHQLLPSSMLYEPTSVLDSHLTSSPAAAPHPPPTASSTDEWDPLLFFDFPDVDLQVDPTPPPSSSSSAAFDRSHLDLLLKAAASLEANELSTAHLILARLNQMVFASSSPLQCAAAHFRDALLSLLPIPEAPAASPHPPNSTLEVICRIAGQKAFSDLSPVPQFTSFTANQTLLEALLLPSSPSSIHVIDFDIGLGGQWSSFAQEIAARSRSLRSPPPHVRITAVVPDETVETVLAAENLRDFARGVGINLSVSFVHVSSLGTLALARVKLLSGEPVGVVLTPTVFRLIGGAREATAALLKFVRGVLPRTVVFVESECIENSVSFRRSFASGLEYYAGVMEAVEAAAAAASSSGDEADAEVRRVEEGVVRGRVFAAVAGWVPREAPWGEVLAGAGFAAAGFSEFTEAQAEWLLHRAPVEGFHVERREGAMVLSWRGRELAATSAWRC